MTDLCPECGHDAHGKSCFNVISEGVGVFAANWYCQCALGLASDAGVVSGNPAPVPTETGGAIEFGGGQAPLSRDASLQDGCGVIPQTDAQPAAPMFLHDEAADGSEWDRAIAAARLNGMKTLELMLATATDEQIGKARLAMYGAKGNKVRAFIRELCHIVNVADGIIEPEPKETES